MQSPARNYNTLEQETGNAEASGKLWLCHRIVCQQAKAMTAVVATDATTKISVYSIDYKHWSWAWAWQQQPR